MGLLVLVLMMMFVPSRGAKNYILWHEDGKITTKGSWRKRDSYGALRYRSRLENRKRVSCELLDTISSVKS